MNVRNKHVISDYGTQNNYNTNPDYFLLGTRSDGNDSTKSNKSIIAFGVVGLSLVVLVVGGFIFQGKLLMFYKTRIKPEQASVQ